MTYLFLFDFILRLYAAESRLQYLREPTTVIDIITIFPTLAAMALVWFGAEEHRGTDPLRNATASENELEFVSQLNFLRVVRLLRILRLFNILRRFKEKEERQSKSPEADVASHILRVSLTFFSTLFCFAGLFLSLETQLSPEAPGGMTGQRMYFHDALYNPQTLISKPPLNPNPKLYILDPRYFAIVTVSSVGYGEIQPKHVATKTLVM